MNKKNEFSTNSILNFKRWSSKGYSAFASIGKVNLIKTLLLSYFVTFTCIESRAQSDTLRFKNLVSLNEVEIKGHRSSELSSEVGRVVKVINRAEIDNLPNQSLQEVLRNIASVDVRQRGSQGVQADISMRGGSFDQILVLLNGVNVTDPQTGHFSLNLPIDLQSVERIEILEGTGTRMHGPSAFSGAINIITSSQTSNNVKASLEGGEYGFYNIAANATIGLPSFTNYIAANKSASDGYMSNTDFDILNFFYQAKKRIDNTSLDFQIGHTSKDYGAQSFYSSQYPNQYEINKVTFGSLGFKTYGKVNLNTTVYYRSHYDVFELFRDYQDAPDWYEEHNYHLTNVLGASFKASTNWKLGKTVAGGELRNESIWSTTLGNPLEVPVENKKYKDNPFTNYFTRNNFSVFVDHTYSYKQFALSAGLIANYNNSLGYDIDIYPGIDLSYWLNGNIKIYTNINKAMRLPTFTDLFYSGPTNEGNPNLKPEEAVNYELGMKYINNALSTNILFFNRNGSDMIDWGYQVSDSLTSSQQKYTTSNLNNINTYGFEASFNLTLDQAEVFRGVSKVVKRVSVDYAYLNQDKNVQPGYVSAYVYNYLKHKLSASIDHNIYKNLSASWSFIYQDRVGQYTDVITNIVTDYEPFTICNLMIQYKFDKFKLYSKVDNLFDKKYSDLGNIQQPQRWFKLGIQYNL